MQFTVLLCLVASSTAHLDPITYEHGGHSVQQRSQDSAGNFQFAYNEAHPTGGSYRTEAGNGQGQVVGEYGLTNIDGRRRSVRYTADGSGFKARVTSNEPGVAIDAGAPPVQHGHIGAAPVQHGHIGAAPVQHGHIGAPLLPVQAVAPVGPPVHHQSYLHLPAVDPTSARLDIPPPKVSQGEGGHSEQQRSQDAAGNYHFAYTEEHPTGGSYRRERGNAQGQVSGTYGLRNVDGRMRSVKYSADSSGFRATLATNEHGVGDQSPADVLVHRSANGVKGQGAEVGSLPSITGYHHESAIHHGVKGHQAAEQHVVVPGAAAPVVHFTKVKHLAPAHVSTHSATIEHGVKGHVVSVHAPIVQAIEHHAPIVRAPAQVSSYSATIDHGVKGHVVAAKAPAVHAIKHHSPIVQAPAQVSSYSATIDHGVKGHVVAHAPIVQAPAQVPFTSFSSNINHGRKVAQIVQPVSYSATIDHNQGWAEKAKALAHGYKSTVQRGVKGHLVGQAPIVTEVKNISPAVTGYSSTIQHGGQAALTSKPVLYASGLVGPAVSSYIPSHYHDCDRITGPHDKLHGVKGQLVYSTYPVYQPWGSYTWSTIQ